MAEPTQLAYRTLKGIGILNAAPVYEELPGFQRPEGSLRCCCYSPEGRFFAWASPEQVSVIDASVGHIITTLPAQNVYELGFSPLGTYIITWQRPSKDEEGNAVKNLKVWRTLDDNAGSEGQRSVVGEFVQRNQTGWNLQYTSDEEYCARVVTNEVQFYESSNLQAPWNRLRVEGVTDFAVASGSKHSVAVFIPERKGQPAAVRVYNVPYFETPASQKTFFKGDKVQLKWNKEGNSLIVLAQTEVDKTNKSYYGETNMYILSADGGFDARISLDKEGPIHDVAWSPNSKEFGVVYGYMPAKATIFNSKAQPTHTFPLAPRNTIIFSPHGRFVIVAGFGNLAGQMDIYDMSKNFNKVCTIEASNASVCEWSPDGTHILCATTSPRLRVDNGIRLYHVGGGLMYNEDIEPPNELYHICWRPESTTIHPIPDDPLNLVPTPHPSALTYLGKRKTPSAPAGAYRPPGARGTSTPLHFKREDQGGEAYTSNGISSGGANGFGASRPRKAFVPGAELAETPLPPGAAPGGGVSLTGTGEGEDGLSKAALKNKKKREAKKAKEKEEREKGLTAPADDMEGVPRGPRAMSRSPDRGERRGHHQRTRSGYVPPGEGRSPQRRGGRESSRSRQGRSPHSRGDIVNGTLSGTPATRHIQQSHSMPPPSLQTDSTPPPDLTITSPGGGQGAPPQKGEAKADGHDKKVRALLKKIRAIEELKMRQAGGEKLEDTQVKKIATEAQVRKELKDLTGEDS